MHECARCFSPSSWTEVGPKLLGSVEDAPSPERRCVLTSPELKPRALHGEQSRGHLVGGELLFRQPVARQNVIEGVLKMRLART